MRKQIFFLSLFIGLFPWHLKSQDIVQNLTPEVTDSTDIGMDKFPDLLDNIRNKIVSEQMNVIPPSPQSALFEQYINHEVAGYNGLPDISIPLYEINHKTLTIPINISYHASGIKYKQFDGEMGAGWSIPAGGFRITRTVYGKPDELYPFYNATEFQNKLRLSQSATEKTSRDAYLGKILYNEGTGSSYEYISSTNDVYQDGEYDQFIYNLPRDNGHFIISNRTNKTVAFANSNQYSIEIDPGSSTLKLESFKIIDNQGNIYYFGGKVGSQELVETRYITGLGQVKTAWFLRMIETPYGEQINFNYSFHMQSDGRYQSGYYTLTDAPSFLNGLAPLTYYSQNGELNTVSLDYYNTGYVSQISTTKEIIDFIRQTPPDRYVSPYITEIKVTERFTNSILKRFQFSYAVSPAGANLSTLTVPCHNLLTKLTVGTGTSSSSEKKYDFTYYNAPQVSSTNNHLYIYPDQWGYYKTSSTTVSGDLAVHSEFKSLDYLYYSSVGSTRTAKLSGVTFPYNTFYERSTNTTVPNYFSLKDITFPTGGKTQYEYESNKFKLGTQTISGSGLRIKKITSTADASSIPVISEFIYGQNEDGVGTANFTNSHYTNFTWGFADETYYYFSSDYPYVTQHIDRATMQRVFSNRPLIQEFESMMQIYYPKYVIRQYDSATGTYNGKTVCNYFIQTELDFNYFYMLGGSISSLDNPSHGYGQHFAGTYYRGRKPTLSEKLIYNASNQLLYKETYTYKTVSTPAYSGVKLKQMFFFPYYDTSTFRNSSYPFNPYNHVGSLYGYGYPQLIMYKALPASTTQITYDQNGANPITNTITYGYDSLNRLISTTRNSPATGSFVEEYTYPASGSALYTKNMLVTPIQTVKKNKGTEVERIKYNYPATSINLQSIQSSYRSNGALKTDVTFNSYGPKGNIRQYTRKDGVVVSYIWGYDNQYPIAEIVNASLSEICSVIGRTDSYLLEIGTRVPTAQDWAVVKSLYAQRGLDKAEVRVYMYNPLVGMTQSMDPNGFSTYYTYDIYGRLTEVYYMEGSTKRVIESYNYNYINK